jgi:2'-5' RNA ligase
LRLFIAALLPEDIKRRISDYINRLKPDIEGVKWEKPDKLHVTLKFLGEVDDSKLAQISNTLDSLYHKQSPFKMNITRFGGFPGLRSPRVLFVGLSENEELSKLHAEIQEQLGTLGFQRDERRFIPHVTIGRVKKKFSIRDALPLPEKTAFEIRKIGVIKSELNKTGSVYTPVELFDLGG